MVKLVADKIASSQVLAIINRVFVIPLLLAFMAYTGSQLVAALDKIEDINRRLYALELIRTQSTVEMQRRIEDVDRRGQLDAQELSRVRVESAATREAINSIKSAVERIERNIDSLRSK